jgi:hypothetical protein
MKRTKLPPLLVAMMLLGFILVSSCEKNDSHSELTSVELVLSTNAWILEANDSEVRLVQKVPVPEITQHVFQNGTVICYFKHSGSKKEMLPYIETWIENGVPYTETLSFFYEPGSITFVLEASDAFYDPTPRAYPIHVALGIP